MSFFYPPIKIPLARHFKDIRYLQGKYDSKIQNGKVKKWQINLEHRNTISKIGSSNCVIGCKIYEYHRFCIHYCLRGKQVSVVMWLVPRPSVRETRVQIPEQHGNLVKFILVWVFSIGDLSSRTQLESDINTVGLSFQ